MNSMPLDQGTLDELADQIRFELRESAIAGATSAAVALEYIFDQLFGLGRSREDRLRFMVYAAPIARSVAIELAPKGGCIGVVHVSAVLAWLRWIDEFDPALRTVLDLHFFAGLSAKDTAFALKVPGRVVTGKLRLARDSWLRLTRQYSDTKGVA